MHVTNSKLFCRTPVKHAKECNLEIVVKAHVLLHEDGQAINVISNQFDLVPDFSSCLVWDNLWQSFPEELAKPFRHWSYVSGTEDLQVVS